MRKGSRDGEQVQYGTGHLVWVGPWQAWLWVPS